METWNLIRKTYLPVGRPDQNERYNISNFTNGKEVILPLKRNFLINLPSESSIQDQAEVLQLGNLLVLSQTLRQTPELNFHQSMENEGLECLASQQYSFNTGVFPAMFHLLDINHLLNVHTNTLSGIEIDPVVDYELHNNQEGGAVTFKSSMENRLMSSISQFLPLLRPKSEMNTILSWYNNFSVKLDLCIDPNQDRRIVVWFHILPLNSKDVGKANQHELFVDIYTKNLPFPPWLQKLILSQAIKMTVAEDKSYIYKIGNFPIQKMVEIYTRRKLNFKHKSAPLVHFIQQKGSLFLL